MSEPTKPTEGTPAAGEDFKNFKAEIDRKLGNIKTEVANTLKSSQDALLAQLQKMTAPQKPQPSATPHDDIENLFYKDPKAYTQRVKEETRNEIKQELAAQSAETNKRQSTIQSLYKEFPELNHDESDLTKLAITKYTDMAKDYGDNPATYKAAVAEAALELGLKPKSKRPPEEESFSVGGSGRGRRGAERKSDEVSPETLESARLMGLDDKAIERMKKRVSSRKNFGKWE